VVLDKEAEEIRQEKREKKEDEENGRKFRRDY
jgi:hypothetical protein